MSFRGSVFCFEVFRGKTSKNLHDVRMIGHEMCSYVLGYRCKLYLLFGVRIDNIYSQHMDKIIQGQNVMARLPRTAIVVLQEDPTMSKQAAQHKNHLLMEGSSPHRTLCSSRTIFFNRVPHTRRSLLLRKLISKNTWQQLRVLHLFPDDNSKHLS